MRRLSYLFGLATAAATVTSSAKDFPLVVRSLEAPEAMRLSGRPAGVGQPTLKLPRIKRQTTPVSAHPVYGWLRLLGRNAQIVFRVDESQGDGKGYDRLILDLNQNWDLTDDPVIPALKESKAVEAASSAFQTVLFGPIPAPAEWTVGLWRPSFYARIYVRQGSSARNGRDVGPLWLKAGNYLEAQIEIGGVKERIGLVDADGDGRFSEAAPLQNSTGKEGLYLSVRDVVLRDRSGSGRFQFDPLGSGLEPFSNLLYIGVNPYVVSLAPDLKWVRLKSYEGPLGELTVQPHGEQIHKLALARETAPGQWEQLNPSVVAGKAKVPVGRYLLYSCLLTVQNKSGAQLTAGAYHRFWRTPVVVEQGKIATLLCGGPLELKVTAEKQSENSARGLMGVARSLFSRGASSTSELRINMIALGAGGETYSVTPRRTIHRRCPNQFSDSSLPMAPCSPRATWSLGEEGLARTHGEYPKNRWARRCPLRLISTSPRSRPSARRWRCSYRQITLPASRRLCRGYLPGSETAGAGPKTLTRWAK